MSSLGCVYDEAAQAGPKAEADGLTVQEPNDAVKGAAIVMFLTPDMVQKEPVPKGCR